MPSPSQVRAARAAENRITRVLLMAEVMQRQEASSGACTYADLCAAGFAEAEIEAYRDDARRLIGGLDHVPEILPPGRVEGRMLVAQAQAIRARRESGYQVPAIEVAGARIA
ncbi:hypothetical protein MCBMB27_02608 [Methylobacterium phyllosphaerae]|uniref:Uncharacterized protein n=1 Tax=Methylobacterium phyllosphaerae TaxID=418223 RepID=A0AAE8HSK1_9HYPH|nr:hypothetical protein [Methylobacterium phyllosphaerae]APT31899.1 hypothetical protein MCBMB27_02608 [Methylobacterium phyllosphaerae]SFH01892.1 hypothetical protein SAMN05192567_11259 [Methylobacterium phyllosphaerae]